ncbi:hypothetical protein OH768_20390 [Streptomyces sp. NBC_01622]|uniref:hypothetical protein n=1 Tax=Streptomyces sp. NBC_01622 TaxID=2975903 RepID=UPI0038633FE9|nr:hypothetical protein OH768_20390 [Streptomyces sp. NBC_01622]
MIWPAALSGAALRVTRTAAGRRVLQLALLVGGLFVFGLVCGGQAQAADGVLGKPVSLGKPGIPVAASVASVVKPVSVQVPVVAPVLAPVSDTVERVVRPVSDVVTKTVTAVLAEAPSLPELPTLPTLPGLPSQPSRPVIPVRVPSAHTVPVPVRSASQPSGGGHGSQARSADPEVGVGVTYGPPSVADAAAVTPSDTLYRARPAAGPAPAHQAPNGDPDGAPRNQSAVDGGTSRHCDAHAVTSHSRVPVRFVPGVAARADVVETRDRYRDVPVFPG